MAEESDTIVVKEPSQASTSNMDLSAQINAALDRRAGETVKCVRVFGDNYRCNWWARADPVASSSGGLPLDGTMLRVRRSSFLTVTSTPDGLQIRGLTSTE